MNPAVKQKIGDLLEEKIKQIKYGAGVAHPGFAYLEKWGIRRIRASDLLSPLGTVGRRRGTTLVHIQTGFYEIPVELIEKVLVLGSFPPH